MPLVAPEKGDTSKSKMRKDRGHRVRRALRLPLLLALAPLLAGCVQDGVQPAAVAPDVLLPEASPLLSRVVSVVDPEGGMGEPSLGVAPDGVLFTNGRANAGPGFDPGAAYRSDDGGATWTKLGSPTAPMPSFDPDLAVDADGTVWFDTLWLGCTTVAVSRDLGETWTMNPLACAPPAGDRQYVIPTKGGEAYVYAHSLPSFYQMVAKTTDYGRTWIPLGSAEGAGHHLLLGEGSGWGGGGFWNAATGSVFLTYSWFSGDDWHPAASVTRDGGATWEVVKLPTAGGDPVGLSLVVGAADQAGNVYLAWAESHDGGKDMRVYLAASRDDGRSWSGPVRVDDGAGSKLFPTVTALAPGRVAVAYYEADEDAYPANVGKGTTWNVTLSWTTDALADAPAFQHGRLNEGSVRTGPICPDGTTCRGDRQLLDYFQARALPDGRVAAVWASTDAVEGRTVNVFAATGEVLLR